jgi:hypothetical protein
VDKTAPTGPGTGFLMAGPIFRSPPVHVDFAGEPARMTRADIVFEGVDQSGPSYEARVYLNNPVADTGTGKSPAEGYAGAFHVYGEGRPGGPPAPTNRYITATEAVRRALRHGPDITVTVVAVAYGPPGRGPVIDLRIERAAVVIDDPPR